MTITIFCSRQTRSTVVNTTMSECYPWLQQMEWSNATTIADINKKFITWHLGGITLISLLIPVGIVGNTAVIWIYLNKFNRSSYRTYVLCLAIIDITGCCLSMPYLLTHICFPVMFPSSAFCKAGAVVTVYVSFASGFTLIIIAAHRYRKICKNASQFPHNKVIFICLTSQGISLFFSWPAGVLYGDKTVDTGIYNISGTYCSADDNMKNLDLHGPYYIMMNAIIFVSTAILGVLYFHVIREIRCPKLNVNHDIDRERKKAAHKSTITMFLVTVVYCVTFLPHAVLRAVEHTYKSFYCDLSFSGGFTFNTFVWSFLINNVTNPFVYLYSDRKFKREFNTVCDTICCRKMVSSFNIWSG